MDRAAVAQPSKQPPSCSRRFRTYTFTMQIVLEPQTDHFSLVRLCRRGEEAERGEPRLFSITSLDRLKELLKSQTVEGGGPRPPPPRRRHLLMLIDQVTVWVQDPQH